MDRAARAGARTMLIVVDLDLFKTANDSRGHQFGDAVLRFFASRLRESVRDDDVVARVGGDEFLVAMVAPEDPKPLVERIYSFITCAYEGFPISASMGIALSEGEPASMEPSFETRTAAYDELFGRADVALYEMKKAGRGGYAFASKASSAIRSHEERTALSAIDGPRTAAEGK